MELIFLGTGSNNPTPDRNVSSLCFRVDGDVWLFDAGEATQIQLMKSPVKPGKLTKIFITHLHGDHVFGLPGLMCTISQNVTDNNKLLEIYGPLGLRRYIRTNLELSRSLVTYKYVVHEMVPIDDQIPDDIKKWKVVESDDTILHPSEILGNTIQINQNGFWQLLDNDKLTVKASWIKHRIPSFGFVIEQKPLVGKLDVEALKKRGVPQGPLYAKIKNGEIIELPDGTKLNPQEFIGPSRAGKKITILGDCEDCSQGLLDIAKYSDVFIHECTLEDAFVQKATSRGHSTPSMAAKMANAVDAKCLILNHFSQRYKPSQSLTNLSEPNPVKTMEIDNDDENGDDNVQKLIDEAKKTFNYDKIYAAYDLWVYKII